MLEETNPLYTIFYLLFSVMGLAGFYVFSVFIFVKFSMFISKFFKSKKK